MIPIAEFCECPHCGAGIEPGLPSRWECGTTARFGSDRASRCHEREADQLCARICELERRVERLVEAGGACGPALRAQLARRRGQGGMQGAGR